MCIRDAIKWQIENYQKPSNVCCIYPAAPLICSNDLKRGLKILKVSSCDYVFSATNYAHPIQRAFKVKKNGKLEMFFPKNNISRSQDLDETFHDAGQFYWGFVDAWLENKPIISVDSKPILIPRHRVIDIDTLEDWQLAETMFEAINKKTK